MFEELEQSELGSQEYWDKLYKKEIENYKNNGDVGEIWFGEDIVDRVLRWILKNNIPKSHKIVDVGCGNGMMLIELHNEGFTNLYGVDYSEHAITLAEAVKEKYECNHIEYSVCDLLGDNTNLEDFDVVFDKGTYDAISLSDNAKINRNKYIKNVAKSLKENGLLILNSCNWTECEVVEQFKGFFEVFNVIPTPQFKFGGKVGNVVSSVVLKKIK
nr:EEF1A lysine methyltransferase 2 [Onthophagus taurus]